MICDWNETGRRFSSDIGRRGLRAAALTILAFASPVTAMTMTTVPVADELIPPVPYTAQTVAFVKTFVVTAMYRDKPCGVTIVVVDSQGLAYSTSQQGDRSAKDAESRDRLEVKVTSLSPVVFDLYVRKADANAFATRNRVAVGDLEQGDSAFALHENALSVVVKRLPDEVDLR
jgi:hypothetical protein